MTQLFRMKFLLHDILAGIIAGTLSLTLINISGCKPLTVGTQSAPTLTFYPQASKVMADYSSILLSAQNLFTSANAEGLVPTAQYQSGQKVFLLAGQDGEAIVTLIHSGASQATIIQQVNALAATISTMPTAFAIKNAQSQAEFVALTGSLTTLLDTVGTLVTNPSGAAK